MKKLLAIIAFSVLLHASEASAQSVNSFTAAPQTANSGSIVSFIWDLQGAGGYSFLIPCVTGIKIKQSGNSFACGNAKTSKTVTDDYINLTFSNITGGSRSVTARIIPKDAAGNDVTNAQQDVSILIAPISQPILYFSSSATSTISGSSMTLSWGTQDIDGVNISMECNDSTRVSSPSYTGFLPCGTPIFSNDLTANGSLVLNFTNPTRYAVPVKFTLLPAISSKLYDGTHAAYITINVASDVTPDPIVNSFSASATTIDSNQPVTLSWSTEKTSGVNLKISCLAQLSATSTQTATSTLPCDTNAFSSDLATTSSATFWFQNRDKGNAQAFITLIPARKAKEYDATRSKQISITIKPAPLAPQPPPGAPAATQTATSTTSLQLPATKIFFKTLLKRGSKGNEVSLLQEFLKKDSSLYPEGLITGFYGPATERAVQKFQIKHGIVSGGSPATTGYGATGPKTRIKLNSLQ